MRPGNQCPNCGAVVNWGATFCGNCGSQLNTVMQAPPQQFTPAQQYSSAVEYQERPRTTERRLIINYNGSGSGLFGRFLLLGILSILTVGIYYAWAANNLIKYVIEHTIVEIS